MEKVLPKGWVETELKNLGQYINGRAFKPTEWKKKGIPIIRIQNLNNPNAEFNYSDEEFDLKFKVEDNELLMAWSASLGVYFWNRGDAWLNQHIFKVIPNKQLITKRFLYYCLEISIDDFYSKTHGTGIVHITKPVFENHKIPLPPLAEQERIVAKVDALFVQYEAMKKALERIPQLLKNFRQQVLTQAVTGKLTDQWREGKVLEDWTEDVLLNLCISVSDGDHQAPPKADRGIPFLVISDISSGQLDVSKTSRFVPNEYYENLKNNKKPSQHDILYTVTGSFGIPVIVSNEEKFCFQRHIAILKPNHKIFNYRFLFYFLKSHIGYKQAQAVATGTAQMTVPLGGLRKFLIPFPPLQEQQEIVSRVESLFAKADAIEARYKNLKEKIASIPQALLHKAFKGELVTQLPTDGDAKDLLAEIIKLKEEAKPKKGKKKSSI